MKKQQQTAFLIKANKDLEGAKSEQSYKKKILDLVAVGVKASEMITALETDANSDVLKARFNVVRSKLKAEEKAKALVSAITLDPDATHESAFGTKERTAPSKASEKSADVRKTAKAVCELIKDGGINKSLAGLCAGIVATFEAYPLETAAQDIFIKVGDCLRTGAMRNEWDAAKTAAKDAKAKAKDDAKAKAKAEADELDRSYKAKAKAKAKAEASKANRKLATSKQLASAKGKKQKVTK